MYNGDTEQKLVDIPGANVQAVAFSPKCAPGIRPWLCSVQSYHFTLLLQVLGVSLVANTSCCDSPAGERTFRFSSSPAGPRERRTSSCVLTPRELYPLLRALALPPALG